MSLSRPFSPPTGLSFSLAHTRCGSRSFSLPPFTLLSLSTCTAAAFICLSHLFSSSYYRSLTHSLTRSHSLYLSDSLTLSLSLIRCLSHSLSLPPLVALSLSWNILPLLLLASHSLTRSPSHTLSHSHSLTHTHSFTHSLFPLSLLQCLTTSLSLSHALIE